MNKLTVFFILAIIACSPKVVTFSKSEVDRASAKFPNATAEYLVEGRTAYQTYCKSCHLLKSTTAYSEESWRKIVPGMVMGANKKAGSTVVDSKMEDAILAYVVTMATAPKK